MPFETKQEKESSYNAEFVDKIMRYRKDFQEGRFTTIKTEDLWKLII